MRDCEDSSTRAIVISPIYFSNVFRPRRIRAQIDYYVSLLRSGTCLRGDARGRLTIILDPRLALLAPPVKRVSRLALFGLAYFQIRAGARERIFRASCISYLRRRRELDSTRAENVRFLSMFRVPPCQAVAKRSVGRPFDSIRFERARFRRPIRDCCNRFFIFTRGLDIATSR